MVRDALGEDAIIIATREDPGPTRGRPRGVTVTAAIDADDMSVASQRRKPVPAFEVADAAAGRVAEPDDWLQYDDEDGAEGGITEQLTEIMIRHGVPEDVSDPILSCCMVMGIDDPRGALVSALENLFRFAPIMPASPKPQTTRKATMFIGPPGAGKTLTTAKFAAKAVLQNMKAAVITADTLRAGGVEQLEAFTRLLEVPLYKIKTPSDLKTKLAEISPDTSVFIDMPGLSPFSTEAMKTLAKFASASAIEPVLVMPAGLDAAESADMARLYNALGVRRLVGTRLDMARRYGGLLAAANAGNMAFAEIGNAAHVAEGLQITSPKILAHYLLPGTNVSSPSQQSQAG